MVVHICPQCNQPYVVDSSSADYIHDCGNTPIASSVLKNEDVLNIGPFIDPDGSTGNTAMSDILLQGTANKVNPRAMIEGIRRSQLTSRGNRKTTHRTRKVFKYIDLTESI